MDIKETMLLFIVTILISHSYTSNKRENQIKSDLKEIKIHLELNK